MQLLNWDLFPEFGRGGTVGGVLAVLGTRSQQEKRMRQNGQMRKHSAKLAGLLLLCTRTNY